MEASPTFLVPHPNTSKHKADAEKNETARTRKMMPPMRINELAKILGLQVTCGTNGSVIHVSSPSKNVVRKQLWSTNPVRRGTVMKADKENTRTTVYNRPAKPHKNTVTQTPLIDLEKFEANPKKFKNFFASPKTKPKVAAARHTVSNIKFVKPVAMPSAKPVTVPKIVVVPPNDPKKEENSQNVILEEILRVLNKTNAQVEQIGNRLETLELYHKAQVLRENSCCRCCSEDRTLNNDNTGANGTCENTNLIGVKEMATSETKKGTATTDVHNGLISLQKSVGKINVSDLKETSFSDTNTTVVGDLNAVKERISKTGDANADLVSRIEKFDDVYKHLSNSKFELLEEHLKNNPNISPSISTPESPFNFKTAIETLVAKDLVEETASESLINSTWNFNNLTAPLSYNDMRDHAKFLCTPVVKKTVTTVLSTKQPNSNRKIISRRIQEQLLMLDKNEV